VGVILAGGLGRRIGGSKAMVALAGRPLISYPLAAMQAVLEDVAVIAKAETQLPSLAGVTVWIERESIQHPLVGLIEALELAGGRPVLACPVDLPFVTPRLLAGIAAADRGGRPALIARSAATVQPLLGCYEARAAAVLDDGARRQQPVLRAVAALEPAYYEVDDPDLLFNINSPEDVLSARAMLDQISRT
jgi:molybdopterin-guanine dinucleotide biosynthesis protein A